MTALLLAACTADPWAGAPDPPAGVEPETWTVTLHGHLVGTETRWVTPDTVLKRRALHVLADGQEHVIRSSLRLGLAPDGRATAWSAWSPGRLRGGTGSAWVPDVAPPPAPGRFDVLDPERLAPVAVDVARDGDTLVFVSRSGPVRVVLEGDRPVRAEAAAVVLARVSGPVPEPPPLDVARALSVPARAFPGADGALVGVYGVGGREVRVEAPTWDELPPERERVRALVREVADRLYAQWVPAATTGAAALAAGAGDCTEHAQALVELAERDGLAARTVAGRLYVERDDGAWLVPHAWAEVELGGRWVAVDPALGQVPADARHLPLGRWIAELAATDGDEIEVVLLK